MDATILTTFFSFIILVLVALQVIRVYHLQALIEHHIDLTIAEKEHSRTALKILQHLEAQVHLMFNNMPPAPGEPVSEPQVIPEVIVDYLGKGLNWDHEKPPQPMLALARQKLKEHQIKVKPPQLPKKRGRPKKASNAV